MFCECLSLSSLPDISKWNTNYLTTIGSTFDECSNVIASKVIKTKFY